MSYPPDPVEIVGREHNYQPPPPLPQEIRPIGCLLHGDDGYMKVLGELRELHVSKAQDYGSSDDSFANYVQASEAVGEPDEFTCWLRILEKSHRALNLIRAGRANENLEGLDVAALAIGAEALRRRRL